MMPNDPRLMLLAVGAVFALVPIAITISELWDVHRRIDTVAHSASGVALAAFSVALLPLGDLGHVLLVTGIGIAWEIIEPRLEPFVGPLTTGRQDTEADVAVVGLSAALLVLVVL